MLHLGLTMTHLGTGVQAQNVEIWPAKASAALVLFTYH